MLTSTRKVVCTILYTVVSFLVLGNETGGLMQTKHVGVTCRRVRHDRVNNTYFSSSPFLNGL